MHLISYGHILAFISLSSIRETSLSYLFLYALLFSPTFHLYLHVFLENDWKDQFSIILTNGNGVETRPPPTTTVIDLWCNPWIATIFSF